MVTNKGERTRIIAVSSSSKKAGKSSLASHLVRELSADYGLKVSSGGRHKPAAAITTDPGVIAMPGTDTGSLLGAGAKKVVWVHASGGRLGSELRRALGKFPPGGLLVMEGNSALAHINPDFSVFLMSVPLEEFKPSAAVAMSKADLVLIDRSGKLGNIDLERLKHLILRLAGGAKTVFYRDEEGRNLAWEEAARMARERITE